MVTRMFEQDCPIDGCEFHIRVEGKDSSVKKIMSHVTKSHRLSDKAMDQDYCVNCPLVSCHEKFTGRQWVKVSVKLVAHLKDIHSTWIDPERCQACADKRMADVQVEIHKPKDSEQESEDGITWESDILKKHVSKLTDGEYRQLVLLYNGHIPPGTAGAKLMADRTVVLGHDYR